MNQDQAAKHLGVTPQMLRIYTKQGRVAACVDTTKKRRTLLYEEAELARFQREREAGKRWQLPKPDNPSTEIVSFRLDTAYLARLSDAAQQHHLSLGEYARQLVMQGLDERTTEAVQDLRDDLATSILALLILAGNQDADEARAWVNKNLRRKG